MKTYALRFSCSVSPLTVGSRKEKTLLVAGIAALGMMISPAEAALTAYRSAVLGDGATAYWEFEETTGTVANDSAGGDNNGTFLGGMGLNQTGGPIGLGRSAGFDGVD